MDQALEIDFEHQDSSSLPFNLVAKGRMKVSTLDYEDAIDYLLESSKYLRGEKDKFKYPTIYYEIANAFLSMGNDLKAKEYSQKAVDFAKDLNLGTTLGVSLFTLGKSMERLEDYESASRAYEEAIEILKKTKRKETLLLCQMGLFNCNISLDKLDNLDGLMTSINELAKDVQHARVRIKYDYIKAMYLDYKRDPGALKQFETVYKSAIESSNLYLQRVCSKKLSQLYKEAGNYSSAFNYLENHSMITDSMYAIQELFIAQNLEADYNKKDQDNQIKLLAAENSLKSAQLKQQKIIIWGSLIALFIFAVLASFIFQLYNKVRSQKELVTKSLDEKNVLLREIHHRVKNNLQVVSSLLALQSKYIQDDNALNALQQGQDRVHSMALIHEDLYRSENIKGVDTEIYFEQLIDNLFESYNIHEDKVDLEMDVEPLSLDVDTMIPLGLILNELVSNSLKHAFKSDKKGKIWVRLHEVDRELILEVKDNGTGISNMEDMEGKSFGYELVKAFARKLKAKMDINFQRGLGITLNIAQYEKVA